MEFSTVLLQRSIPFEPSQVSSLALKKQPCSKTTIFKGSYHFQPVSKGINLVLSRKWFIISSLVKSTLHLN